MNTSASHQIFIDTSISLIVDGTLTAEGILQFLDDNKFPLVTVLTELNSAKVYSITKKPQVAIAYKYLCLLISTILLSFILIKFTTGFSVFIDWVLKG